ncbi:GNAT family N-acetyltransferase [Aquimonas voraii]|uniref:Ribosomal protein S18 acetylase RimI n=1 Tax=Aquimonas voraii TaxID=265719 RepID=A0A1G6STD8_9GAMM|nr:GNAT family N-acetyltransferase [Aquimonas voraii]SDD20039.1 Ribosomal protein S18 acetylase RimI [Aquimonas voraii]
MTAPKRPHFTLRPIDWEEREQAYVLTREAMRAYIEQTWGPWSEAEQRERHARTFNPSEQDFIVRGNEVLGLRALRWRPTDLFLARLYLRPQAQGQGLGSAVLTDLLAQARAMGRSVELQVLKVNAGAQRFYTRHGFERVGERDEYWLMRSY